MAELSWRIEHASHVQLSGVGEVPPASGGFAVPVRRDTMFVLTAYDALLGTVTFEQVSVAAGEAPEGPLPRGAILAWDGGPVPEGFAPCDGSVDDVPDLSGLFIRGAGHGVPAGADDGAPHGHDAIRMPLAGELLPTEHTAPRPWRLERDAASRGQAGRAADRGRRARAVRLPRSTATRSTHWTSRSCSEPPSRRRHGPRGTRCATS